MGWPWHFVALDSEAKGTRRQVLAQFAFYSQLSVLVPIVGYQLYRLGALLLAKREKKDVAYTSLEESSDNDKPATASISSNEISRRWRAAQWWLDTDIAPGWGLRGRWIAGIVWSIWLLFLCMYRTGDDYFHLTKRFGSVAAAQLPFHYLLAMRTRFSPLIILFGTSHEQLIRWHEVNGKIIMIFLLVHGSLYLNYFIQSDSFVDHLKRVSTATGFVAVTFGAILAGTSLERVRRWSYKLFFLCHIGISIGLLPILLFHAKPLRLYTVEALGLFILDRVLRRFDTITEPATITQIPHTDLLKIEVPIPPSKINRFRSKPAQHVYVSLPTDRSSGVANRLLSNPFTVADVSSSHVTLVLRAREGPTTQTLWSYARHFHSKPMLSMEGPYGIPINSADLVSKYDQILLVSGGIGATFTWPIYWALREQMEAESRDPEQLKLIWAVRSTDEASWTKDSRKEFQADESNIQIYLTRHQAVNQGFEQDLSDDDIELGELTSSPALIGGVKPRIGRPFLKDIVDQVFSAHAEERVAVLFCGPQEMGQELRSLVGVWASIGRDVMWHEESFGM